MKKFIMLVILAMVAGTSQAATDAGSATSLSEGTKEIVIEGLFDGDGFAGDEVELGLKYGQFIADNIEVGGEVSIADNDFLTAYLIGAFAEYNWDLGTAVVPFVGTGIRWLSLEAEESDADDDGYGVYGEGGVKYFLTENVAVSASAIYEWASEDVYVNDDEVEDTNLTLNLAMRFYIP